MGKKVVHRIPKDFYLVSKRNRVFIDKKKEESLKACRGGTEMSLEYQFSHPDSIDNQIKDGKIKMPNFEIPDRETPNLIDTLKLNEIFVFGSNESGRHGKGAAKTALKWGAKYGQAFGLQGSTFAIPTVNASVSNKLFIEKIKYWVDRFIQFAKENQDKKFLVTEIGCGLAGWKPKDIAPLFKECTGLLNVSLPKKFWRILMK